MKASELIEKLEEKIQEFGDLDVYSMCEGDTIHCVYVDTYWKNGNKKEYIVLE